MNVAPQNDEIAMKKLEHTFHILIKKSASYRPCAFVINRFSTVFVWDEPFWVELIAIAGKY